MLKAFGIMRDKRMENPNDMTTQRGTGEFFFHSYSFFKVDSAEVLVKMNNK